MLKQIPTVNLVLDGEVRSGYVFIVLFSLNTYRYKFIMCMRFIMRVTRVILYETNLPGNVDFMTLLRLAFLVML